MMQLTNVISDNRLTVLWQYFDELISLDNDDVLFASSYVRGFLSVAAVEFGDDEQSLCRELYQQVSIELEQAKSELSNLDHEIVNTFWYSLESVFHTIK